MNIFIAYKMDYQIIKWIYFRYGLKCVDTYSYLNYAKLTPVELLNLIENFDSLDEFYIHSLRTYDDLLIEYLITRPEIFKSTLQSDNYTPFWIAVIRKNYSLLRRLKQLIPNPDKQLIIEILDQDDPEAIKIMNYPPETVTYLAYLRCSTEIFNYFYPLQDKITDRLLYAVLNDRNCRLLNNIIKDLKEEQIIRGLIYAIEINYQVGIKLLYIHLNPRLDYSYYLNSKNRYKYKQLLKEIY